jgi:acyl transferase domain-containing protein
MLAVRAPAEQVERLLGDRHPEVVLANRNSPQQVVLSGPLEAVTAAEAELAAASLIVKRLPTSAAFHSPLVGPAVGAFLEVVRRTGMQPPGLSVYANATAEPYPAGAEEARELLGRQLVCPVRFQEMVERLAGQGVRTFVEVGPGAVLTGLVRECLRGQDHLAVALDRKGLPGLTGFWQALGQLAVQGVVLRWERFWEGRSEILPPRAVPAHAVSVSGASKGLRGDVVGPGREASSEAESSPLPGRPDEITPSAPDPETVHLPRIGAGPRSESASVLPITTALPCHGAARVAPNLPEPLLLHGTTRPDPGPTSGQGGRNGVHYSPLVSAQSPAGWADAVQDILREAAQAHQRYFELVERSVQALVGVKQTSPQGRTPDTQPMSSHGLSRFQPSEALLAGELNSRSPRRTPRESAPFAIPTAVESAKPLQQKNGSSFSLAPTAPTRIPEEATGVVADAPTADQAAALEGAMLQVVAEKTGYPAELLEMGMEIEADLGIASLNRVEILAALEAAVPALAGTERSRMAGLRTLGDLRDLLLRSGTGRTASPRSEATAPGRVTRRASSDPACLRGSAPGRG